MERVWERDAKMDYESFHYPVNRLSVWGKDEKLARRGIFHPFKQRACSQVKLPFPLKTAHTENENKCILWDKMMHTGDRPLISSFFFFLFTISYDYCFLGNAMQLIGSTLVNCCCYCCCCWVLSEYMNVACSPVSRPTPHRFLLRSLCAFPCMSCVTGLKNGRGAGEGEKCERVKETDGKE